MTDDTRKVSDLVERIRTSLTGNIKLTGEVCEHGWDRAVCVMKKCNNPYATDTMLSEAADEIERLTDRLSFAEFEWNRATDGMKERDAELEKARSEK